jgi:hypothetical protein
MVSVVAWHSSALSDNTGVSKIAVKSDGPNVSPARACVRRAGDPPRARRVSK